MIILYVYLSASPLLSDASVRARLAVGKVFILNPCPAQCLLVNSMK